MGSKIKILGSLVLLIIAALLLTRYLRHTQIAVFAPAGIVASKERNLIVTAIGLMLLIVVPVFVLLFGVAYRYRASNKKARYSPNWDGNRLLETAWWLFPCAIIAVISILTWNSSHELDPFRALDTTTKPLPVQVVALQWRWLFIYPQQHIASVNMLEFPKATPLNFEITSDAPMNSFWIPRLGGQIYAMPGMSTQLHLMANQTGTFRGYSANLSGAGFAGMNFTARSTTQTAFNAWVANAQKSTSQLSLGVYSRLSQPSQDSSVTTYSLTSPNLYNFVIDKYSTAPGGIVLTHAHGGGD